MSYSSERTIKATVESLGINTNMLHRWRNQDTPDGDKTQMAEQDNELRKLQYRIAELEEENDILKKASDFFAKIKPVECYLFIEQQQQHATAKWAKTFDVSTSEFYERHPVGQYMIFPSI